MSEHFKDLVHGYFPLGALFHDNAGEDHIKSISFSNESCKNYGVPFPPKLLQIIIRHTFLLFGVIFDNVAHF